jgi:murein DD-endopeptidase MepM/ murein hydrolase activator NlpD
MKNTLFTKRARLLAAVCVSIFAAVLAALVLSNRAAAQPTTFLSPLQQSDPFLSVPYYGMKYLTAYVDHDPLGGGRNSSILIFDGRTASLANGWCDGSDYNPHIAFWTSPNPPRQCLWYDAHHGNDFDLDYEPVLASADGTVVRAGWDSWADRTAGYGLHLRVSHDGGYQTIYGHLSALTVITNALVTRGQIIGTSGNTGNSTGSHLHFEVRQSGTPTDPFGGAGSHWLWQDGSWDARGRWVGQSEPRYGSPLIVDDDDPQQVGDPDDDPYFTKGHGGLGGTSCPPDSCPYWYRDTSVGWNSDVLYTFIVDTADYWARWAPPRYGLYDVQVWIPSNNATAWHARYWLVSSYFYMPMKYVVVDQWGTYDRWIDLGVYEFGYWPQAPWIGWWISDSQAHGSEYWRKLGVDAMRFRSPWSVYIPLVLKGY